MHSVRAVSSKPSLVHAGATTHYAFGALAPHSAHTPRATQRRLPAGHACNSLAPLAPSHPPFPPPSGILTVGVVTYPFNFEGRRRANQATDGIDSLRQSVDSVIVIPNDRLLDVASEAMALQDAFSLADDVLRQGVQVGGRGVGVREGEWRRGECGCS